MKTFYQGVLVRALLSITLYCAAFHAQAITISTTGSRSESGGVRYYFVVSDWGASSIPSPCISTNPDLTICLISIIARHSTGTSLADVGFYANWKIPARDPGATMGLMLDDLNKKGLQIPLRGSILVDQKNANSDICIGFTYALIGGTVGGGVGPLGPCVKVSLPTLQCEITGDSTINHSTLPDDAVEGAQASTQLSLKCASATSVRVTTSYYNWFGVLLRNDGSLYSKITVNGKDATGGIDVNVADGQPTNLDITSTLRTRGTVAPGEFSGSTVVTVSLF